MNCMLFVILLFTIIENVFGRIVNFSLITFGEKASVVIPSANKTIEMEPTDNFSGVQSASVICPDEDIQYSYTINGQPEGITRTLKAGELKTHNEFIGREETIKKLKGLGYPADKKQWTRSLGKTDLFDDSYIPTVIIDSGSKKFFSRPYDYTKGYTFDRVTIITKDKIYNDTDVETKPKNRYQEKIQFRIKLQKKLFKRKIFKFRPCGAEDPAIFREALYGDVAAAIGNPVHNQVLVRVYLSDGTSVGLYLMIEVTSSKSFIKTQFYGDVEIVDKDDDDDENGKKIKVKSKNLGPIYDCATGADFSEGSFGSFKNKDDPDDNKKKLKYLSKAMKNLDVHDEAEVKKFSKEWLDLDTFFKALALEYLAGHWDSYWMYTSNFVMYNDPLESTKDTFKFYFIDQDFDQTFGVGFPSRYSADDSYTKLIKSDERAAIKYFLKEGSVTRKMFDQHMKDIVQHVFNPVALGRRLEQYTTRYEADVKWNFDEKITRTDYDHPEFNTKYTMNHFTYSDYTKALGSSGSGSGSHYGLKEWIETRAKAVTEELDFEWDQTPLDPVEKSPIENDILDGSNLKNGAGMTKAFSTTSLLLVTFVLLFEMLF